MVKVSKYELSLLFSSFVNSIQSKSFLQQLSKKLEDPNLNILETSEIGRYDILYKNKTHKINLLCIRMEVSTSTIAKIKEILNKEDRTFILKYLLLQDGHNIIPKVIDYKYPIEMKKYLFESIRIMPRELTKLSKKHHKIFTTNVKRGRSLGLIFK